MLCRKAFYTANETAMDTAGTGRTGISGERIRELWKISEAPVPQDCIAFLTEHLYVLPRLLRGDTVMKMSPAMEAAMSDYWLVFIGDMIKSINVLGVVPWVKGEGYGEPIPRVLKPNSYHLSVRLEDDEHLSVHASRRGWRGNTVVNYTEEQTEDNKVYVLDGFGFSPDQDGKLHSPMAKVRKTLAFQKRMMECLALSETARSKPYLVTQERKQDFRVTEAEYAYTTDSVVGNEQRTERYRRDKQDVDAAVIHDELVDSAIQRDFMLPKITEYAIRNGREICRQVLPESRSDYVNIMKYYDEQVCRILSVPRGLLYTDTSIRSNTHSLHTQFQQTMVIWAQKIATALTTVYYVLYGDKEADSAVKNEKVEDLDTLVTKNAVRVEIPLTTQTDPRTLLYCYAGGMIDWLELVTNTRAMLGFSTQRIPYETDPLTEEQRMAFVHNALGRGSKRAETDTDATGKEDEPALKRQHAL